jgi:hypothetical protein
MREFLTVEFDVYGERCLMKGMLLVLFVEKVENCVVICEAGNR